jgi:hypothetical protein
MKLLADTMPTVEGTAVPVGSMITVEVIAVPVGPMFTVEVTAVPVGPMFTVEGTAVLVTVPLMDPPGLRVQIWLTSLSVHFQVCTWFALAKIPLVRSRQYPLEKKSHQKFSDCQ